MNNCPPRRNAQRGMVLILIAFIIGLGAAAFMYKMFNASNLQAAQDEKTMHVLNEAKSALMAWSVSHPNFPGIMPFPDRNDDPNKYDTRSDCVAVGLNGSHLIGRFPVLSDVNCVPPQNGLGFSMLDGGGEQLWYSVSQNLIRKSAADALPVINPGIVNSPTVPWFVVRNRNGVIISDRVAVVIFSPGAPLPNQDRSGGGADANQYLDKVVMADGTQYKNYGYQDIATNPVQEFIIGDDDRNVSRLDPTYKDQSVEPYYFNDKLVYITIDELVSALSVRAAAEAKAQLVNYKKSATYYPYASALVLDEYYQKSAQYGGFLPISQPQQTAAKSCSVSYANVNSSSTTCDFASITNVEFTRTSGTFNSATGGCALTGANRTCRCATAAVGGSCSRGGRRFTCTATGCATTGNLPGSYVFNGAFQFATSPTNVKINGASGACNGCGTNTAACAYVAATPSGSFSYDVTTTPAAFNSATTNSALPAWFVFNRWQDYLYYAVSSSCTYGQLCATPDIRVGDKASLHAMLAATGAPIVSAPFAIKGAAQTHNGCDVKEYLDSTENTNLDTRYEPDSKPRIMNYNDQTFVVAP